MKIKYKYWGCVYGSYVTNANASIIKNQHVFHTLGIWLTKHLTHLFSAEKNLSHAQLCNYSFVFLSQ